MYNELYSYTLNVLHELELFEEEATSDEKSKWYNFLEYRAGLQELTAKEREREKLAFLQKK